MSRKKGALQQKFIRSKILLKQAKWWIRIESICDIVAYTPRLEGHLTVSNIKEVDKIIYQ